MTDLKLSAETYRVPLSAANRIDATDMAGPTSGYILLSDIGIPGGWVSDSATWTYASASTFTVPGDQTAIFVKGTRLKWTQTTVKYGCVASSSYAAGTTTVTILVNTDYVITNAAISANHYSYLDNPVGWPFWFNYSTTPTGGSHGNGTVTAKYAPVGKLMWFSYFFTLGSTSTVTGDYSFNLPTSIVSSGTWIATLTDTGVASYVAFAQFGGSRCYLRVSSVGATYGTASTISATVPHTWGTNDTMLAYGNYEW